MPPDPLEGPTILVFPTLLVIDIVSISSYTYYDGWAAINFIEIAIPHARLMKWGKSLLHVSLEACTCILSTPYPHSFSPYTQAIFYLHSGIKPFQPKFEFKGESSSPVHCLQTPDGR